MLRLRNCLIVLFILATSIRLYYGLSELEKGFLYVSEGDYTLYQIGAEHIIEHGNFDNSLFLVRPPLYPLIIALLSDNQSLLLIINAFLGGVIALLTFYLAYLLNINQWFALFAGFAIALDPGNIIYTAFLGPEALSFVAALALLICLLLFIKADTIQTSIIWLLSAAGFMLISAYARPSIYLLTLIIVPCLLIVHWRRWTVILMFALLVFVGIKAWEIHNRDVFGNESFSTISAYTMAYYRAAAVLNQATDFSIDEVYIEIGRRVETKLGGNPDAVDLATQHRYLAASPEVEDALNATSLEIFLEYPQWYLITLGVGIVRFFQLSPEFPPYENLFNLSAYPLVLWNWIGFGSLCISAIVALQKRDWRFLFAIILVSAYFTAGTLMVKSAGMTAREMGVIRPLMMIATAYTLQLFYHSWRKNQLSKDGNLTNAWLSKLD